MKVLNCLLVFATGLTVYGMDSVVVVKPWPTETSAKKEVAASVQENVYNVVLDNNTALVEQLLALIEQDDLAGCRSLLAIRSFSPEELKAGLEKAVAGNHDDIAALLKSKGDSLSKK